MKRSSFLSLFILAVQILSAQSFSILSWNIQDLGRTKDAEELATIASVMRDFDLIAIQEVVAKDPAGAQSVAKIADLLNRMGNKWDYRVSPPTQSPSPHIRERYAFIWKTAKLSMVGTPYLDKELKALCYREPFIGTFKVKKSTAPFTIVNFHSRKYYDHPEEEIQYFSNFPQRLGSDLMFIAGDFNLTEKHEVWKPLRRQGFISALIDTRTTLKRKCKEGIYVYHAIDNIFYHKSSWETLSSGVVDFVKSCDRLEEARGISDHLPVFLEVGVK